MGPQSFFALVYRRGHGRDGVHRGGEQHERPRQRVPAVPGRYRGRGRRVRRGGGRIRHGRLSLSNGGGRAQAEERRAGPITKGCASLTILIFGFFFADVEWWDAD